MSALQTLLKVRRCGVELVPSGGRLRFHPVSALTPELVEELRENKEGILEILARPKLPPDPRPPIENAGEVLEIARNGLPELKEEDRVELGELIEASSSPEPGRDPLAKHETDKAHFFHAPADCACDVCMPLGDPRGFARRKDGKTYTGDDVA